MQTVLFTKLFKGVELAEVARRIRDIGFDGIDLLIRNGHQLEPAKPREIATAITTIKGFGLTVPMATCDVSDAADPVAEPMFAACHAAGVRVIRMGYYAYDPSEGYDHAVSNARRKLEGLERLAEKTGQQLALQIHGGTIHGSGAQAAVLLKDRNPNFIGVYPDPGNQSVQEGREDWRFTFEVLKPWICCVGVKNGGWFPGKLNAMGQRIWASDWLGLSEGMVPWDQILTQLKSDGFTGILTVHGPYEMGLEQAVDQLGSDLSYIRRVTGAAK